MTPLIDQEQARIRMLVQTVLRFQRRGAKAHIRNLLRKQHPADIARMLQRLPSTMRSQVLVLCGAPDNQADVLSEMDEDEAANLLIAIEPRSSLIRVIEAMSSDDAASLLRELSEEDRSEILSQMANEESEDVEGLLNYRPGTAGAMMTPEVLTMSEDTTVEEAIKSLRQAQDAQDAETVFYIYAVNDLEQLVGVISLRQLVVSDAWVPLGNVMEREVVTVAADDDQEEVAKIVEHYNFIALPVVDDQRHLLGIITVDDILDVLREEATEDLLRMSGAGELPQRGATVLSRIPGRLAWLTTATTLAIAIAWVVFTHLSVTAPNLELVSLLPLLLILPMAAAMQSAAVAIGAVTMGTVSPEAIGPYLLRESGAGALSGILFGGLAALGVGGMDHFNSITTVGSSVACSVALATFMGSGIPLLIYRFKRDPTVLGGLLVMGLVPLCSMILGLFVAQLLH